MSKRMFLPVILGTLLVLLAGCRTTKPAAGVTVNTAHGKESARVVRTFEENRPHFSSLTAKLKLTLESGGKSLSGNGTLKWKKDSVLQLSVSAMGLFEVARIEFMPTQAWVINRIDKTCAMVPYSQFKMLKEVGIDFAALQALFLNRLFAPGQDEASDDSFTVEKEGGSTYLAAPPYNQTTCRFFLDEKGCLAKTLMDYATQYKLQWLYTDFSSLSGKPFPNVMQLTGSGENKSIRLTLSLSNLKTQDFDWSLTRCSYKRVEPDKILPKF